MAEARTLVDFVRLVEAGERNVKIYSTEKPLGDKGVESLAKVLMENNRLRVLDLQYNKIGPKGAKYLGEMLRGNKSLRSLILANNRLGAKGAALLSKGLEINRKLHVLNLTGNEIGDSGAQAIAQALETNRSLTTLWLYDNGIGDEGGRSLADMLRVNTVLENVSLEGNDISRSVKQEILDRLITNRSGKEGGYGKFHSVETREFEKAFDNVLVNGTAATWSRSRILIVGNPRSGKTSTLRAMLNQPFNPDEEPTLGIVSNHEVMLEDRQESEWIHLRERKTETLLQAYRAAAKQYLSTRERDDREFHSHEFINQYVHQRLLELEHGSSNSNGAKQIDESDPEEEHGMVQSSLEGHISEEGRTTANGVVKAREKDKGPLQAILSIFRNGGDDKYKINSHVSNMFDEYTFLRALAGKADDRLDITIWDYGGSPVFYTMYHALFARYGIYLVVFDMRDMAKKNLDAMRNVRHWLDLLKLHSTIPQIILVGTHLDSFSSSSSVSAAQKTIDEILRYEIGVEKYYSNSVVENLRANLIFFPVDNVNRIGISQLQHVTESTIRSRHFGHSPVPLGWVNIYDAIRMKAEVDGVKYVALEQLYEMMGYYRVSINETQSLLNYFREIGAIIHFETVESLKTLVVLDPQWMVNVLTRVIFDANTQRNLFQVDGRLAGEFDRYCTLGLISDALLKHQLRDFEEHTEALIRIMRILHLIRPLKNRDTGVVEEYIVPCMLPLGISMEARRKKEKHTRAETRRADFEGPAGIFDFEREWFLPEGLFQLMICICLEHSRPVPDEPIYGDAVVFSYRKKVEGVSGLQYRLVLDRSNSTIIVQTNEESAPHHDTFIGVIRKALRTINREIMNQGLACAVLLQRKSGNH